MITGVTGPAGTSGARGPYGKLGRANYFSTAWIFALLTLILFGVAAVQVVAFNDFRQTVYQRCIAAEPGNENANQLRKNAAIGFAAFAEQERTNKFIDDELRAKRVKTWSILARDAQATVDAYRPTDCTIYQ